MPSRDVRTILIILAALVVIAVLVLVAPLATLAVFAVIILMSVEDFGELARPMGLPTGRRRRNGGRLHPTYPSNPRPSAAEPPQPVLVFRPGA